MTGHLLGSEFERGLREGGLTVRIGLTEIAVENSASGRAWLTSHPRCG